MQRLQGVQANLEYNQHLLGHPEVVLWRILFMTSELLIFRECRLHIITWCWKYSITTDTTVPTVFNKPTIQPSSAKLGRRCDLQAKIQSKTSKWTTNRLVSHAPGLQTNAWAHCSFGLLSGVGQHLVEVLATAGHRLVDRLGLQRLCASQEWVSCRVGG